MTWQVMSDKNTENQQEDLAKQKDLLQKDMPQLLHCPSFYDSSLHDKNDLSVFHWSCLTFTAIETAVTTVLLPIPLGFAVLRGEFYIRNPG